MRFQCCGKDDADRLAETANYLAKHSCQKYDFSPSDVKSIGDFFWVLSWQEDSYLSAEKFDFTTKEFWHRKRGGIIPNGLFL